MELEGDRDLDFDLDGIPSTEQRHLAKFVNAVLLSGTPKTQQAAAPSPQFPHMLPDGIPLPSVVAQSVEKPLQEAINTVAVAVSKDLVDIPADGSMLSKTDDVLGMALQTTKTNMNQ